MNISDIKQAFEQLVTQSQQLNQLIYSESPALYLPNSVNFQHLLTPANQTSDAARPSHHALLAQIFNDFYYRDGQDGRETRSFHGVVNASEAVLKQAVAVNECKDKFRASIAKMRNQEQSAISPLLKELQKTLTQTAQIDRSLWGYTKLTRVHLKQCYRHIPILAERPVSVGFSWYVNGKSLKKVSHKDAMQLLVDLGPDKPHIRQQIQILSNEPRASELIQVQQLAPIVRANIAYKHRRQALNCSLPLLIPAEMPNQPLPTIKQIPDHPPAGRTRKARNDGLLEPEPLLKSLRIHRLGKPDSH